MYWSSRAFTSNIKCHAALTNHIGVVDALSRPAMPSHACTWSPTEHMLLQDQHRDHTHRHTMVHASPAHTAHLCRREQRQRIVDVHILEECCHLRTHVLHRRVGMCEHHTSRALAVSHEP